MRSYKLLLFLLCRLLFCTDSMAQPYTLRHLGVEDGLSNNYVRDIAQDKQGCIWVATELGLNRFDGCNFTTYKSNNSQLINDALNVLLYDETENVVWIGGKFDGISALDCSTYQFYSYTSQDEIRADNIVHLSHASDGGLWLTPHYGNIVHYDKHSRTFTSLADMGIENLNKSNWCCFDDGEGHLYIGHAQSGMSIINLKNKTVRKLSHANNNPQSLPGNSIYSIYKDHLQNIWVGTNRGLGLFNPKTEEFTVFRHESDNPHSLIADHIYDIKEMNDGTLWIAATLGDQYTRFT